MRLAQGCPQAVGETEGQPWYLQLLLQAESLSQEHVLLPLKFLPLQLLPLGLLLCLGKLTVKPVWEHSGLIREGQSLALQCLASARKRCHRWSKTPTGSGLIGQTTECFIKWA